MELHPDRRAAGTVTSRPVKRTCYLKVAKFILGAANRDPESAAKYLEGHAVMILGVAEANVVGLKRFEAKDFVGAVQPPLALRAGWEPR
jgi:hypothetical protein